MDDGITGAYYTVPEGLTFHMIDTRYAELGSRAGEIDRGDEKLADAPLLLSVTVIQVIRTSELVTVVDRPRGGEQRSKTRS